MVVAKSPAACKGFNQKDLTSRLFSGYEKRPEWYDPTSSLFFDLVKTGTLPHHAAWLVHQRSCSRQKNGSGASESMKRSSYLKLKSMRNNFRTRHHSMITECAMAKKYLLTKTTNPKYPALK
jgi:hypothetical protein